MVDQVRRHLKAIDGYYSPLDGIASNGNCNLSFANRIGFGLPTTS